jgi:hypothetical protein
MGLRVGKSALFVMRSSPLSIDDEEMNSIDQDLIWAAGELQRFYATTRRLPLHKLLEGITPNLCLSLPDCV